MQATVQTGCVTGGVRTLLRLEGLAVLTAAVFLYWRLGFSWSEFALLFLAPDLSFFAYLFGPRFGAAAYNVAHSTNGALGLAVAAVALNQSAVIAVALIWLAHIGFDRSLGYGLKYGAGFGFTHLGRIGRKAKEN
ncbi:MAG: DUF4260 domain-containing protein [Alphaproteobacteria bacterium]|nr:DUF4260 domain-containing protein [Alphaproteobacteria bacterium]MBL6939826.1 DUF4260 domain-containing protein [Alphaproteobacteria bacterium]MBL7098279.1 DUF4260 domain-containing protein [Alphaproteobacteria bacterium]